MQLFLTAFESVPDPRAENSRHNLVEILLIAFLAELRHFRAMLRAAQHCDTPVKGTVRILRYVALLD